MSDKQQIEISFATPLVIVQQQPQPSPAEYRAIWTFQIDEFIFKGAEPVANTMAAGSYATLSVQWTDKYGNPAPVQQGSMNWQSSDTSIATVEIATGNPLIANVKSLGPIGDVSIQATGDADLGDGVQNITAVCPITVIAGQASAGTIAFQQYPGQMPPSGRTTAPGKK